VQQRCDKRQALGFRHPRQVGSVQGVRLGRELAKLLVRNAGERMIGRLFA
jgi:hypothetical protein